MADLWSERLKAHPFHSEVELTLSAVAHLLQEVELPQEEVDYLRRAENVLKNLTWRVERADGRLTPLQALDGTANQIRKARATLDEFLADRNRAHLERFDVQIDAALIQVRALPPLQFRVGEEVATNAAKAYAETLRGLEASVREEFRNLLKDIQAVAAEAEPVRAELDRIRAEADQKVTEVTQQTDARIAEVRTEIDSQKARLDQVISAEQEQFSERQVKREDSFEESRTRLEAAFGASTDKLLTDNTKRLNLLNKEAAMAMETLKTYEGRAAQIVGITATAGVAGAYKTEADDQRKEADSWRQRAFAVGLFLLVSAGLVIGFGAPAETSTRELLVFSAIRLPVGLALLGAFTYAARESGQHRRREQKARLRFMELTAFRPFLAELEGSDLTDEIKAAARRFFVGETPDGQVPYQAGDASSADDEATED